MFHTPHANQLSKNLLDFRHLKDSTVKITPKQASDHNRQYARRT